MKITFIEKAIAWLAGAAKKIKELFARGNDFANELKNFADSPIVAAIVLATPTKWDDKALKFVQEKLQIYATIKGIADKTLNELKEDSDVFAATMNELSAMATKYKADYDKVKLNVQQALTGAQVSYNEAKVLNA